MSAQWTLRFIHFLYALFVTAAAWVQRCQRTNPHPLIAQRSKLPKHLCLNLVADGDASDEETETAFLQCLQNVAAWCRASGIQALTVYDRHGVLYGCSEDAHRRIFAEGEIPEDIYESEVEYPLTPPLSESSGSRSHSPEFVPAPAELNVITIAHSPCLRKRRNVAVRRQVKGAGVSSAPNNLTLHLVSRASGKPAIVSACRSLLQDCISSNTLVSDDRMSCDSRYDLTVSKLATLLEDGLPPPDFMIIHHIGGMKVPHPPIEFNGFPPWQITLTEFHRTHSDDILHFNTCSEPLDSPKLISETAFCRALDEYAGAEFRLGR